MATLAAPIEKATMPMGRSRVSGREASSCSAAATSAASWAPCTMSEPSERPCPLQSKDSTP